MNTADYQEYLDAIENETWPGFDPAGDCWLSSRNVFNTVDRNGAWCGKQGPDVPDDFDPRFLELVTVLKDDEEEISGDELQRRAVEELDSPWGRKLLWWLLNHEDQIPEEWKSSQVTIFFPGDYDLQVGAAGPGILYLRDYRVFLAEPHRMWWDKQRIGPAYFTTPPVGKDARVVVYRK